MVLESQDIERILASGITDQNSDSSITAEDILYLDDTATTTGSHEIQAFASRSFTYYASNATTSSIDTPWATGENLETKYGGVNVGEYHSTDSFGLVKTETIRAGCSSCGGSGSGGITKTYFYMDLNGGTSTSPNEVVHVVVEDTEDADGTAVYRTIFGMNNQGVALRTAYY